MKGEEERFFLYLKFPVWRGKPLEHADSGWHHVCQEGSLTPVRTPIAMRLPHLTSKTSRSGSNKLWRKYTIDRILHLLSMWQQYWA